MILVEKKVALVTGASKGVGKGAAEGLGEAGYKVYLTGRTSSEEQPPKPLSIEATAVSVDSFGGQGIPVLLDHNDDSQVRKLVERIRSDEGRLDVLVNNVYQIPDPPAMGKGFWEHPVSVWDDQCGVGLRGYYVMSALAAPLMVERKSGLIVNISSRGGREYVFSASYGVGKAGVDRMAKDMALELKSHNVAALSLSPSKVKTEFILDMISKGKLQLDPSEAQSARLTGRVIAAFATDPDLMSFSGGFYTVSEIASHYGVLDPEPGID
jgi:dehydrogenase/reductase SDR family protein 1